MTDPDTQGAAVSDAGPLAVLPLGATEQHGPHLPTATDTLLAAAAARTLAGERAAAVLLPAWEYGASGEHQSFPGTVSIGTDALAGALLELARSAGEWAGRLLVVNGHGGNVEALRRA
ncbi:MAG TPA: creatininase family protein, partial [Actinomycetales bacterium]|nr:creatininase family protein [Actinomycetales bacterium]